MLTKGNVIYCVCVCVYLIPIIDTLLSAGILSLIPMPHQHLSSPLFLSRKIVRSPVLHSTQLVLQQLVSLNHLAFLTSVLNQGGPNILVNKGNQAHSHA